jgi:hypothetical protein
MTRRSPASSVTHRSGGSEINDTRPLPRLRDYGRHVRVHRLRLIGLALVGALIGGVLFFSIPTRFYATTRVALSPQITYLSLSPTPEKQPLVTLDTTAGLVRSDYAVNKMAEAMDVSAEEARESTVISAKPGSRVLIIQVRADTRDQAQAGSHAATEALIELQAETFALGRERVRLLKNRVATLEAQAQASLAEGQPSNSLFESVRTLEQKLDRAVGTNNTESQVIMRAVVLEYRPGEAEVFIVSGLTIGLTLALIWAGPVRPGRRPGVRSGERLRARRGTRVKVA